jgi:tetratricopeptide (TPR) repeat protein
MLSDLAGKLIGLRQVDNAERLPNVIFGSANALAANLDQKTACRVAMFPAISQTDPQLAMGVMTCLAYLLENYLDITVYRQFVRFEAQAEVTDFVWSIEKSQFTFDDWQLDALDDNSTVWGDFEKTASGFVLTLEAESDLLEENAQPFRQEYTGSTVTELVDLLPDAAESLASYFNVDVHRVRLLDPYSEVSDDAALTSLLSQGFEYEAHLLLHLYGQNQDLFTEWLATRENAPEDEISLWLLSAALNRLLLPGLSMRDQLPDNDQLIGFFIDSPKAVANLARSISVYDWQAAVRLLRSQTDDEEIEDPELYFTLADLYLQAGQLEQAAGHYEDAMEFAPDNATAQYRAAQFLTLYDDNNVNVGRERAYTEAGLEAYDRALSLGVANKAQVLMSQILLLVKLTDRDDLSETILDKFEALVGEDQHGEYISDAVDELYRVDAVDFDQVFEILEQAVEETPDRIDRQINLATALLVDEALDDAAEILEKALQKATTPDQTAEIQRLMLYADDPEFESIMGEIIDKISAKTSPDETEIDYLEQVVEAAPKYSEGYQLLVQGYQLWNEPNAAMETLLDAVKELPDDPEILVMLAQALLTDDQDELAIQYLQRSASKHPLHVPTLALLGKALFDDDQYDEARTYISRAERLTPRHPALLEVRTYIAGRMAEE